MNKLVYGLVSWHNFDSRLLVLSDNSAALEWMRESIPRYDFTVTLNISQRSDWPENINNDNCHHYKITASKMILLGEHSEAKSMNILCQSWLHSYQSICNSVNYQRRQIGNLDVFKHQHTIYQIKLEEARNILDNKLDDLKFLKNEALIKNLTLKEMANSVLLQDEIQRGFLARTELMRVKWLDQLKKSTDIEEHKKILKEVQREINDYHRLS